MQSQPAFSFYFLPHSHQFLFINLPCISLHMLTLVSQKTVQIRHWFLLLYSANDNSFFVAVVLVRIFPLPCQTATHSDFGTLAMLPQFENLLRNIFPEYVYIRLLPLLRV